MIIFSFQSMLDACSVSVWNAEDSSETRLLVTCWLQESEKISVSQCFGSMTYHIPLVILYIHRLFLSACSHPWWFNSSPAGQGSKRKLWGLEVALGCVREDSFFWLWIMLCTFYFEMSWNQLHFRKAEYFRSFKILWLERWLERSSYLLSRPFGCLLSVDCRWLPRSPEAAMALVHEELAEAALVAQEQT